MIWPFGNECDHEWEDREVTGIDHYRSPRLEDGDPYIIRVTNTFEYCWKCNGRRGEEQSAEKVFLSVERTETLK